jgi:hypothetical protein
MDTRSRTRTELIDAEFPVVGRERHRDCSPVERCREPDTILREIRHRDDIRMKTFWPKRFPHQGLHKRLGIEPT